MFDSFDDVRHDIARRLFAGASERNHAFHAPVVATADADARVMVLRDFSPDDWTLRFHTDARAPKSDLIGDGSPVGVLFYDKPAKIQVRVRGWGRIETDTQRTDDAWAQSTNFARRCYLGEGPGVVASAPTSGLPPEFEGVEPTEDQVQSARANFAILLVELRELDWFHLAHTGHVRAQFVREDGEWIGSWAAP